MSYATLRVLLVDDFGLARERTRKVLLGLGFIAPNIDEAVNGAEALTAIRRSVTRDLRYDLVISDWNMPELSGIELVRTCRADAGLNAMKIMIVSSESEKGSIVEALRAGADEYAVKPVAEPELITKLQTLFKKAG